MEFSTTHRSDDAFGRKRRSLKKSDQIAIQALGAFEVEGVTGPFVGKKFKVGIGYSEGERADFWQYRQSYMGRILTFDYRGVTSKGSPRHAVFKGFRSIADLSS